MKPIETQNAGLKPFLVWAIRLLAGLWILSACLQNQWIVGLTNTPPVEYISNLLNGVAQPEPAFPLSIIPGITLEWGICIVALGIFFFFRKPGWTVSLKLRQYLKEYPKRIFLLIILAGLLLRVGWVLYSSPRAFSDAADYKRLGWKLASGERYESRGNPSWRPPGYPLLLSLPYRIGLDQDLGARVVDITASLVLPVVLSLLALTLAGRNAAWLMLAVTVFNPILICHSGNSLAELPYSVFFYAGLLLLFRAHSKDSSGSGRISCLLSGASLGYAALIRPPALVALILGAVYSLSFRQKLRLWPPLLILIGAIVIITPWSIRNFNHHRQLVLISTNGGEVFYSANKIKNPARGGTYNLKNYLELRKREPDPAARNRLGFQLGIGWILKHKRTVIESLPYRFLRFFNSFNYAPHGWWARPLRPIPLLIRSLVFSSLLLIPLFLIVRSREILNSIRTRTELKFIGILYPVYLSVLFWFEVSSKSNLPYIWLILLLIICYNPDYACPVLPAGRQAADRNNPD